MAYRCDPSVLAVLHPYAKKSYELAVEHGSVAHPSCVAFVAEIEAGEGYGPELLAEQVDLINERRTVKGLPPIPYVDLCALFDNP